MSRMASMLSSGPVLCGKKKDGRPCYVNSIFPFSADLSPGRLAASPRPIYADFLPQTPALVLSFGRSSLVIIHFGDGRLGGEAIIDFEHCFARGFERKARAPVPRFIAF